MSKIPYVDEGWPVVTGCTKMGTGCQNCYACRLAATRLKHHPRYRGLAFKRTFSQTSASEYKLADMTFDWTGEVRLNYDLLELPLYWQKPRRVFVCQTGDLFHERVPDEFIGQVFTMIMICPQHTFIVLTKRTDRMTRWVDGLREFHRGQSFQLMPNLWLLVSASTQDEVDAAWMQMKDIPAAILGFSLEPLLASVMLPADFLALGNRAWVICGGESGKNARPMHPDWARSLRDQCVEAGVPFYLKQIHDENGKLVKEPVLDGVKHLEYPQAGGEIVP